MAGTVYVDKILTDTGTTVNVSGVHFSKTGNVTFTGTGNRITGDFSNATDANRVMFQTSTANIATVVGVVPNGTSTFSYFQAYNTSNGANAGTLQLGVNGSIDSTIRAGITGTGTYLPMTFYTGNSERMRIDTSGNVGIGTSSPIYPLDVQAGVAIIRAKSSTASNSAWLVLEPPSTGSAIFHNPTNTASLFTTNAAERMRITELGDVGIGTSSPSTYAGKLTVLDGYITAAQSTNNSYINWYSGGAALNQKYWRIGTGGGALVFETVNDAYTTPTERVRIDASGFTQFNSNLVMPYQGAPTSKSGAATLSGAELITGILNTTGTTYTITLPTGTNIEGALTWSANNVSLDWYVINTASGTITIGANGNTTLGSLTIATGTSAHFRIRRTAANTFTVYRL